MTRRIIFLTIIAFTLVLSACKEKEVVLDSPTTIKMNAYPRFGEEVLYLDSVYTTQEGYDVKFTEIKFYLENIHNGENQLLDAALFDYRERGVKLFDVVADPTMFLSLQANLGVDPNINHNDPSDFPNESMLNIANANDMHWGWNPGYIFMKVEAKVDTIQDATALFDHNVVFHIGLDANMQILNFSNLEWVQYGNQSYQPLRIDMKSFLEFPEVIDLKDESSSHSAAGQEALSLKVITNFKNAITLY